MEYSDLKMPMALIDALRCPGHPNVPLRRDGNRMICEVVGERLAFPIVNGTPILIQEENSVFTLSDFVGGGVTTMDLRGDAARLKTPLQKIKSRVQKAIPPKSRSVCDFPAEAALRQVLAGAPNARVLVVGAGDARFDAGQGANVVYTDVALASDTHLIADAHDIPFADGSFDAVFSIAVLGHRRLFRWFDETRSGIANGPGMVVTWSLEYLLTSFAESGPARSMLLTLGRFLGWPFLLFDGHLAKKAGAYDCASACYFFGTLRETPIHDRFIVGAYKGLINAG